MFRKSLAVAGAVSAMVLGTAGQVGASTDTNTVKGGIERPSSADAFRTVCVSNRRYCTTFVYRSIRGGILLQRTNSAGLTSGPGSAREYLVVNGVFTRPTNPVFYNRANVTLRATHVVNRTASCGTIIRTDWLGRNAPPGAPGIRVVC